MPYKENHQISETILGHMILQFLFPVSSISFGKYMRLRKYRFFEYIDSPNVLTIRIYRISECIDYINPRTILGSNYSLGQARTQMASGLGRLESSMNSFETRRTDLRRMVRSTASTMDSVQRSMNSTMTRFSSINDDVRSRYGTSYGSSTLSSLRSGIPQSGRR